MRHRTALVVSLLVTASLLLVGCRSTAPSASSSATDALPAVAGSFGERPIVTFLGSPPPARLSVHVVSRGSGRAVTPKDVLVADYVGQVWGGEVFADSFASGAPLVKPLSALVPGWRNSLAGTTVGSRVLLSVPPADGYGKDGNEVLGIKPTDTLMFVVDVVAVFGAEAAGQADAAPDLAAAQKVKPQVHGKLGGPATLTLPAGVVAPTSVVTTVLARGTGAPVREGDLVGQYAGVDWMGNSVGSSWQAGTPEVFPVAADVPTFAGLIGVPLGSRVLLEEPATTGSPAVAVVVDLVAQP